MRPVRSDYADFFYSYILSRRFFCCFFLVPQIYTDFSLVPNLRNPRPNRSKICVICEICVTFFSRPSRPKICVHLWNLWDSKNFNLRDLKNNQSAGLVLAGTPSGKYKVPQITQICTDFSHAFSHNPLGFFPNGAEWAWERLENLETPFLLCIFAPGVEKTGWKFQAGVDRKLLSKTPFTLHQYDINT